MQATAQGLQCAVQVHFQRAGVAAGLRGCLGQRLLAQAQLLHRLALAGRQLRDGFAQAPGLLAAFGVRAGVVAVGMLFQRELVVQFAALVAAVAAQRVDRAAPGDRAQPCVLGTRRIVGMAHPVDGDQGFLHHVVQRIHTHAMAARHRADQRHRIGQHAFVGAAVARLRGRHPGGALAIGLFAGAGAFDGHCGATIPTRRKTAI